MWSLASAGWKPTPHLGDQHPILAPMSLFALTPPAMGPPGSKHTEHLLCVDVGEVLLGPQRDPGSRLRESRDSFRVWPMFPQSCSVSEVMGGCTGCGLQVPMPSPGFPPLLVFNRQMGPQGAGSQNHVTSGWVSQRPQPQPAIVSTRNHH